MKAHDVMLVNHLLEDESTEDDFISLTIFSSPGETRVTNIIVKSRTVCMHLSKGRY